MSEFTPELLAQTLSACREKCAAIGDALNLCLGTRFQLEAGATLPYHGVAPDPQLNGPGLVVALTLGPHVMLCCLPAALPLPEWFSQPDIHQVSQLQGLAQAWGSNCLPDGRPAESCITHAVGDLWAIVQECRPHASAAWLPLTAATDKPSVPGSSSPAKLWVLWPVAEVPLPTGGNNADGEMDDWPGMSDQPGFSGETARFESPAPAYGVLDSSRANRLLQLPVPIIVKLAQKKIELGQLLEIGPGAIITFEKSCEDLLDLHVNNKLYCRGEAVKIGEKFGLKINEVGSVEERVSALLGPGS